MTPPTGGEEEGKVEEEKQNEATEAPLPVEGETVVFEEEVGAIVEANDQVSNTL